MLLRRLPNRIMRSVPLMGGGQTYAQKVLGYNPYAYWPLWETSGGVAYDISGNAFNGAYTGVTLGQNITDANGVTFTCPFFDGVGDLVDVYSDGFRDAFPYNEGSFAGWMRVFNAAVWTDGATRVTMQLARSAGGPNYNVHFRKEAVNNTVRYFRDDGSDNEAVQVVGGQSETNWVPFVMTWSVLGNALKCYLSAGQIGVTQAGVLAATDTLAVNNCCIGSTRTPVLNPFYGWLVHGAVFPYVLTQPMVTDLATV